jgi:hypothetical protein
MNHVINDRGETVIAVGAPGSLARARCERPGLIEQLGVMRGSEEIEGKLGAADSCVVLATRLHGEGIISPLESSAVLTAAGYAEGSIAEVWKQLAVVNENRDMAMLSRPSVPAAPSLRVLPELSP